VFLFKCEDKEKPLRIGYTEGDPEKCMQELREKEKSDFELLGSVYAKKMEHAAEKASKQVYKKIHRQQLNQV
jgi:hypothetical protein